MESNNHTIIAVKYLSKIPFQYFPTSSSQTQQRSVQTLQFQHYGVYAISRRQTYLLFGDGDRDFDRLPKQNSTNAA